VDSNARREWIAKRIAQEFKSGDVINLGIGLPTLVAAHIPADVQVLFQSENGFVGLTAAPRDPAMQDPDVCNAGGFPAGIIPGGAFFDSATSFAIIRGGHVAATVLGTLEVDQHGNIANWMVPGKKVPGMGGAMDLLVGANKVYVATDHVTKDGAPKLLERCTLPLTAQGAVDVVVTELGYFEITPEGFLLKELAPGATVDEVMASTAGHVVIASDLKEGTL